jgi:hypothetical protein
LEVERTVPLGTVLLLVIRFLQPSRVFLRIPSWRVAEAALVHYGASVFFFYNKRFYISSMKLTECLQLVCLQSSVNPQVGTDENDDNKSTQT